MVIGVCTITLYIAPSQSLKDKRHVLKSTMARIRNEFNVAIAEVDGHDSWTSATVGVACVSTEAAHAHSILEHVVSWIENNRLDAEVVDYQIEML